MQKHKSNSGKYFPLNNPKRIEICGGIASGKTTIAKLLAQNLGAELVLEDFRNNPFWERFYKNPELFEYEKNIYFLAQHSAEIKLSAQNNIVVCDYALIQDLAYSSLSTDPTHFTIMKILYEHLQKQFPVPDFIIRVQCDEVTQIERIRARGRFEEFAITLEYLKRLNIAIDQILNVSGSRVINIRNDDADNSLDATMLQGYLMTIFGEFFSESAHEVEQL
jgi:deoxyadenosine/deoxycytidine kinase